MFSNHPSIFAKIEVSSAGGGMVTSATALALPAAGVVALSRGAISSAGTSLLSPASRDLSRVKR